MLSEISQTQKEKTGGSHLYMETKIVRLTGAQSRMMAARIRGDGGRERYWSKGTKVQLCTMNKLWRSNAQHGG